ncbi:UDP-N-acetylmuramoyl-L-alanyl-D-glutamate--2,6-diaminopimelate ligase [Bartonella sp. DGB1]|uniref:UDP-N-acetylmuramoyl-L-alanyl-D-glutamate--2, 6-diaminopimelate ligase n=1 Tax=Bartonella sp. DGB1 TaxID=3239807 RepID=UPI00352366BA
MKLKQIINLTDEYKQFAELQIDGLSVDSRLLKENEIFFALQGNKTNGLNFIQQACEKKAKAIIVEKGEYNRLEKLNCPVIEIENIRYNLAMSAAKFYQPQPDVVIPVTGTSGKTSVASFLRQIWQQNNIQAANIGTTGVITADKIEATNLTTPDPIELHKILQKLAVKNINHIAIEASSHGLDQYRLDGIKIEAAGYTNLGRDHLDYHKDSNDYLRAKLRLFDRLLPQGKKAVIFADDPSSEQVIKHLKLNDRIALTVGRKGEFIQLKRVEHERFRQILDIMIEGKLYQVKFPLAGGFQVSNALVALGLAIVSGVPINKAVNALEYLKGASGRLELAGFTKAKAPIYIDYAHKPEALEHVLHAVKPFTIGKIILVFGCGGDRDKGKRAIMGKIAQDNADVVIVTDDNPRTEVAKEIRQQILSNCPNALEIADRKLAIFTAIGMLQEGDTLIIAGKGHEKGQIIGDKVFPFSDHEEVLKVLRSQ